MFIIIFAIKEVIETLKMRLNDAKEINAVKREIIKCHDYHQVVYYKNEKLYDAAVCVAEELKDKYIVDYTIDIYGITIKW